MLDKNFKDIISNIKEEIINTQIKTMQEVNSNLIMLYFKLGKIVSENKQYGNNFTKQVSTELKLTFPNMKGFSERNIRSMRLFYEEYAFDEKWQQLVAKLPWGHNLLLIEEIKFVLLGPRMLMAIILTNTGMVKETIIKFDEDITDKQVETINYMFNQKLKGQPLQIIDVPLEEYLINEMKYSVNLIKPIIEQMKKVVEEEKVHLEGAKQLFELPEFNSLEVAKNFVNILDEKELMADMLNTGITKDINVYIGEENEKDELKDFSIVTFKHRIGNKDLGTIGIIGPKRMDYAKVISVMKYISKKLNDNNNSNE